MTEQVTEEQLRRIEAGEEIPPKPDFISQEEWDFLLAARQPDVIRATGTQHAQAYIARVEGTEQMAGAPVIVLTTIGRKSGNEVPTCLNFVRDGTSWIVVGSFFGLQESPHWVKNLDAQPRGWVQSGDDRWPVTATKVEGEEREKLWPGIVEQFPLWGHFQTYCRREFATYRLTPAAT